MTINFCEVCLAVFVCSAITILLYIASWYNHEEKNEENEEKSKVPNTSNIQGLENEKPLLRGEPNETLNFEVENHQHYLTSEHQPSGIVKKEQSDISRLQYDDFRTRLTENEQSITNDSVNTEENQTDNSNTNEYDPVTHRDPKTGRLHLSVRYDNERSKLIVNILDAQGLIRPEQIYAPEMVLTFTLIGPYTNDDDTEKQTRVVLQNAAVTWKEPMFFCITYENATKQNLYVNASNQTDPAAPRDREVSIPLNNLGSQYEEINDWFDLQYVQSSY